MISAISDVPETGAADNANIECRNIGMGLIFAPVLIRDKGFTSTDNVFPMFVYRKPCSCLPRKYQFWAFLVILNEENHLYIFLANN